MEIKRWEAKMYVKRRQKMLEQADLDTIKPLATLILIEIEEKQLYNPKEIVELVKRYCNPQNLVGVIIQVISHLSDLKKENLKEFLSYLRKEDKDLYIKIIAELLS